MARETKVGLLAGLAFIICFAVILANRGREDSLSSRHLPVRVESPAQDRVADGQGNRLLSPKPTNGSRATLPYPAVNNIQNESRRSEPASATGADAAVQDTTPTRTVAMPVRTDVPAARPEPATLGVPLSSPSNRPTGAQMDQTLDDLAAKLGSRPRPSSSVANPLMMPTGPTSSPPIVPAAPGRTYTVLAGDTLSKIAAKHFGSKSAQAVEAIVGANRALVADPDELKAGQVLVIPEISGGPTAPQSSALPVPAKPEPKSKQAGRTAEPIKEKEKEKDVSVKSASARWYQVRKNDRYYSIARDQLGDGARWREIHDLNKDKFPDPEMIREGVRIKLPGEPMADGRDRRR